MSAIGKRPDDPSADFSNIDCLVCHNEEYATQRSRLPDGSLGVLNPTDSMVQNVSAPTRANCLTCHGKAGGGDGVKRGDLSLATVSNTSPAFDVHMNKNGRDLNCQTCHVFRDHLVIGKGSDLRPTDDPQRGSEVSCVTCHSDKDSLTGHSTNIISSHTYRVACQTCHIPKYAKVATEIHRDWRYQSDGSPADGGSGPDHPFTEKGNNLVPEYKFWNRLSDNYLLGDDAARTYDPVFGTYPTSRPIGGIGDPNSKLYPFKYKTAVQPMTASDQKLIAIDTYEYLKVSGDADTAVQSGLANMGRSAKEGYAWVVTDTYQLLNHGVEPASAALQCSECHQSATWVDLKGTIGYAPKDKPSVICVQCHGNKEMKPFEILHDKHVSRKAYDCSWCHTFSRPERGLRTP